MHRFKYELDIKWCHEWMLIFLGVIMILQLCEKMSLILENAW